MDALEQFADALLSAAPIIGDELSREGEDLRPDLDMPTIWFGAAGQALASGLDQASVSELVAAFAVIEQQLATGSELLRNCLATGLLEALANQVSSGRLDGPRLASLLGPESRAYVDAWDQFSLGRSSLNPS